MILPCGASMLVFHPHHFTLLSRIDIQHLACNASAPVLARQEEDALCNSLQRDRLLKSCRSLRIDPELMWVLCTLFPKLQGVDRTRSHGVDSSWISDSFPGPYKTNQVHQTEKSHCLSDPHSPRPFPHSAHVSHQALHEPELDCTLPTRIVRIAPLPKMTTLTPHNYQPHVGQVFFRSGLREVSQLSQPRTGCQECSFDIDPMGLAPLLYVHVCKTLMMRKDREVKRSKCNTACNRAKSGRGSREGVNQG
jgi:hypothetical protein